MNLNFDLGYKINKLLLFVVFSGIVISLYQLSFDRSLWGDEILLSMNIVSKSFAEFLKPLDNNQVSPLGFLFIEKSFVKLFGISDLVLRIFPFISFILSIMLFYKLSKKILKSYSLSLISLALFSLNLRLIYFSSEVKQYGTDVLITLILLNIFYDILFKEKSYSILTLSIIGFLSIWFSHIAIIILFSEGVHLFYDRVYKRKEFKFLLVFISWLLSFGIYYFLFIYHHPTTAFTSDVMKDSFMPFNPFVKKFYFFVFDSLRSVFSFLLVYGPFWIVPTVITFFSICYIIYIKRFKLLYFLVSPILIHLIISGFHLYPFYQRFILYIIPLIILIFVIGFYFLWLFVNKKIVHIPKVLLVLPAFALYLPIVKNIPIQRQELKSSIRYLIQNISKEDKVYVYYRSIKPFKYYMNQFKELKSYNIIYGSEYRGYHADMTKEVYDMLDGNKIIFGNKYLDERKLHSNEILSLKSNTWLIFSDIFLGNNVNNDENFVIDLLKANNYKIIDKMKYTDSSIYKISKE